MMWGTLCAEVLQTPGFEGIVALKAFSAANCRIWGLRTMKCCKIQDLGKAVHETLQIWGVRDFGM